jgi:hypothetical protein
VDAIAAAKAWRVVNAPSSLLMVTEIGKDASSVWSVCRVRFVVSSVFTSPAAASAACFCVFPYPPWSSWSGYGMDVSSVPLRAELGNTFRPSTTCRSGSGFVPPNPSAARCKPFLPRNSPRDTNNSSPLDASCVSTRVATNKPAANAARLDGMARVVVTEDLLLENLMPK